MAHDHQERWSALVLAKLRKELRLQDGIVFNNDYEGTPTAGAVKIPVRDTEVTVADYSPSSGTSLTSGSTSYVTMNITKDKAVDEIIDGYDAEAVPDNLVADRLDSAGYALAAQIDNDGASVLLAGGKALNYSSITKDNVYSAMVDVRTAMSKDNIPLTGRYALATPDFYALLLKSQEFIKASDLGDAVVQTGAIGSIAGFTVYEWNDATSGLQAICGHPMYAARVSEWKVPVHLQDLSGSGTYIGASAVQGRMVYDHKVLRDKGVRLLFSPAALAPTLAAATASAAGKTKISVTVTGTAKYRLNPTERVVYGQGDTGFTAISTDPSVSVGDVIEVAEFSDSKCVSVGYVTVEAEDIKSS